MGRNILLHIGASKCGSSAIQTALSANPSVVRHDGTKINYGIINPKYDRIINMNDIVLSRGVRGYRTSGIARQILSGPLDSIKESIKNYPTDLIFSCEGWMTDSTRWEMILAHLEIEVDVIMYVRPQIPVLNSAWWQWGAWSGKPFNAWMAKYLESTLWASYAEKWKKLEQVKSLTVRPVPADIIADFYGEVLQAPLPDDLPTANPSLPGPLLRLFQRNRSLRPSMHDSLIDFALSGQLDMKVPSIWVLDKKFMQNVIDRTRDDNEVLLTLMSDSCAKSVRDDARWWSVDAFSKNKAESPYAQVIPAETLERMCVEMAQAIYDLRTG
jgi:hypothetical protein